MRKSLLIAVLAVPLVVGTVLLSNTNTKATNDPKSSAEQTVTEYMAALSARDFDKAVTLIEDKRFTNEKELKKEYAEMDSKHLIQDYQILSIEPIDEKKSQVALEISTEAIGTQRVEFVVEQKGNKWKIVLNDVKSFI